MKILCLAVLTIGVSFPAIAQSIDAPGKITYKMPSGEIVARNAVLSVPSRGQGDVVLRGSQSDIVAEHFFSRNQNSRTIFYVVFDEFPGQQDGERAVYRGTYVRGSNKALYYGDVFVVSESYESDDDLHFDLSDAEGQTAVARYVAGFNFEAEVQDR